MRGAGRLAFWSQRLARFWMRQSLSTRIVTVFLVLLVAIQTASFFAVSLRMQHYVQGKLPGRFASGEQVLRHLLAQRSNKLIEDARLLTADYAFRAAVQSHHAETIASVLTNHGARIGAIEEALLRPDFTVQAVSDGNESTSSEVASAVLRLSARAASAGTASEITVIRGAPRQLVLVPMKAPMLIGWVLMGFAMPATLANEVKLLSSLDFTLLSRGAPGRAWSLVQTTLPPGTDAALAVQFKAGETGGRAASNTNVRTQFDVNDEVVGVSALQLTPGAGAAGGQAAGPEVVALLSLSMTQAGRPPQEVHLALILATLMGVVLFGIGSVITARRIITPLRSLAAAAERLGRGDYSTPIGGAERSDEIGDLAQAFEQMRISVASKQAQIIQSEKLASIGQLAAGVAHEINNPMGFVFSNFNSLEEYVERLFKLLAAYQREEAEFAGTPAALRLKRMRDEVEFEYLKDDIPLLMAESKEGIDRVQKIVQDLKDFSHVDARQAWHFANLHVGLDSTLNIASNEIKYRADVVRQYGQLPEVECLASQMNQVFMNLLVNAAHAIGPERGVITLRTGTATEATGAEVWVEVADNGSGIPSDVLQRIFDPFFTTKPVGKGTGLGLSLSYGIVKKHGGRIEVQTELGKGTCFRVVIPVQRESRAEPRHDSQHESRGETEAAHSL